MVKLIMGSKGTGKTKTLVELVKKAVAEDKGSVVCIEKDKNLTYDVPYTARLVHASDYKFGTVDFFRGFICGLHSANYDITDIFIDNFFKMFDNADEEVIAGLLDELNEFGEKEGIRFTISASGDPEKVCDSIKKYL